MFRPDDLEEFWSRERVISPQRSLPKERGGDDPSAKERRFSQGPEPRTTVKELRALCTE
jgi:hypothetical protein